MKLFVLALCMLAGFANEEAEKDVGLRAAARGTNCGCQCDITTFRDKYGNKHGNCNSADKGALWCYVKDHSTCTDLQTSTRFNKLWSFEACATPEPESYECRGYNGGYNNGNGGYNNGNNYPCLGGNCGNSGYNPGNSGYNPGNSGYNPGNVVTSYPCRGSKCGNSGYNPGNSGYNPGNVVTSYPCRGSKCGNSGYNSGNSGYNSGNSGYNSGSSGYNPGNSGYNSGFNTIGGILSGSSGSSGYGSNLRSSADSITFGER